MIVAGTGHRPDKLGGYSKEIEDRIFLIARDALDVLKPTMVISGMAIGWDLALARAALHLKLPLHAAIPFYGQEKKWPRNVQALYKDILRKCSAFTCVSEGGYAAWKMHKRNEWMVDNSNVLLSLFDGLNEGGTAACIRYALSKEKDIYNVWDIFKGVSKEMTRITRIGEDNDGEQKSV